MYTQQRIEWPNGYTSNYDSPMNFRSCRFFVRDFYDGKIDTFSNNFSSLRWTSSINLSTRTDPVAPASGSVLVDRLRMVIDRIRIPERKMENKRLDFWTEGKYSFAHPGSATGHHYWWSRCLVAVVGACIEMSEGAHGTRGSLLHAAAGGRLQVRSQTKHHPPRSQTGQYATLRENAGQSRRFWSGDQSQLCGW